LQDYQEAVAAGCKIAQAVTERIAAQAAPIEIVHAVVEGLLDDAGGRAIARSQAEASDFYAGAAEDGAIEGHGLILLERHDE
jgi:hypothetical protein